MVGMFVGPCSYITVVCLCAVVAIMHQTTKIKFHSRCVGLGLTLVAQCIYFINLTSDL